MAQVIVEIQVQAARRGVAQHRGTGHLLGLPGRAGGTFAQVGHGQRVIQHQFGVGAGRGLCLFLLLGQGGHLQHLHRSRGKQAAQQLVEPAVRHLAAQGGKQLVRVQQQGGVPGVQPARGSVDGVQHAVRQAARPLQRGKLCRIQRGQQQLLRDAPGQYVIHCLAHRRGKLAGALFGGTPQHQLQRGLQGAVIKAHVDVRTQFFGQQGRFQGRIVGAQQRVQQDLHAQLPFPVRKGTGVPGQCALHLVRLRILGVIGQLHAGARLLVLHRQAGAGGGPGHPGQVIAVQHFQLFGHVHLAVQGDAAVVRAVVHPLIFLIGQRRDALRVAAGHKAIGRVREHGTLQRILQLSVRGGKGPLHLVVHHAAHGAVGIPVPALLLEHSPVHHGQRAEHRVQVDVHQVSEIRLVGSGKGVHGLIREGHGIEEGCHAALEQLQKRRGDRVFFASGQHRMLQNMKNAGVIGGEGAEPDAKGLVVVLIFHQQDGGPAHVVGEHGQGTVLLGAVLCADEGITGNLLHRFILLCVFGLALLYHSPFQNTIAGL